MTLFQGKVTNELSHLLDDEEKCWKECLNSEDCQISLADTVTQVSYPQAALSISCTRYALHLSFHHKSVRTLPTTCGVGVGVGVIPVTDSQYPMSVSCYHVILIIGSITQVLCNVTGIKHEQALFVALHLLLLGHLNH